LSAEEIIGFNSFGEHNQIEEWGKDEPSEIFTEMCFKITNSKIK